MSLSFSSGQSLTAAQILARLQSVDGPGSKLDADLVTAPIPRVFSYGSYPQATSAIAAVPADPSATLARYLQGY